MFSFGYLTPVFAQKRPPLLPEIYWYFMIHNSSFDKDTKAKREINADGVVSNSAPVFINFPDSNGHFVGKNKKCP